MNRMPRKLLTGWVEHARPVGCPKMTWGCTLNKALKSYDIPTGFGQWSTLAADRRVWQQRIGAHDKTPHHIQELVRAPRRQFFRQLLQPPLTMLGRTRRTHAHRSNAAQASNWLS